MFKEMTLAPVLHDKALRVVLDQGAHLAALACHRSQMTPLIDDDPEGFVMEPWRQEHFLTHPEIVIAP